ncbi:hypothetical protein RRG08_037631 [Elysia crispata]|uniref:Uncharacterized protein n=1 Tax=Elysia crispata TaxID=231223 RepID=A0AAE0YGK6_9GAST|nr:hypothetical protein RRG08_037631 [Elysia crispata]
MARPVEHSAPCQRPSDVQACPVPPASDHYPADDHAIFLRILNNGCRLVACGVWLDTDGLWIAGRISGGGQCQAVKPRHINAFGHMMGAWSLSGHPFVTAAAVGVCGQLIGKRQLS